MEKHSERVDDHLEDLRRARWRLGDDTGKLLDRPGVSWHDEPGEFQAVYVEIYPEKSWPGGSDGQLLLTLSPADALKLTGELVAAVTRLQ